MDVPRIANLDEPGLHVDPVRKSIELAGADLAGDLEARPKDVDVHGQAIGRVVALDEPVVVALGGRRAERSPDGVESRRCDEAVVGAWAVQLAETDRGRIAEQRI